MGIMGSMLQWHHKGFRHTENFFEVSWIFQLFFSVFRDFFFLLNLIAKIFPPWSFPEIILFFVFFLFIDFFQVNTLYSCFYFIDFWHIFSLKIIPCLIIQKIKLKHFLNQLFLDWFFFPYFFWIYFLFLNIFSFFRCMASHFFVFFASFRLNFQFIALDS